jgi:hypothetical protein
MELGRKAATAPYSLMISAKQLAKIRGAFCRISGAELFKNDLYIWDGIIV